MKLDPRQTDEEILQQYPSEKMKQAVADKLAHGKNESSKNVLHISFGSTTTQRILSVAAIIAVMIVIPVTISRTKFSQQDIRAKGTALPQNTTVVQQQLRLYKNDNGTVVNLKNKSKATKGDIIQLSYTIPHAAYGMILSIDGEGTITKHLPENGGESILLSSADKEIPLATAYQLDDAHYFERFFLITSSTPFSSTDLELAVSAMKRSQAKNESMKKYFPKDAVISTLILIKQD